MNTQPTTEPRGRGTSLALLAAVAVLGIAAYFAGPTIMTYVFLVQEKMSARTEQFAVPDDRPPRPGFGPTPDPGDAADAGEPDSAGNAGGPDVDAIFKDLDKDGNGLLEGDEIISRLQARLAQLDANQDKAISKDEMAATMQGGGGGRGGGRGGNQRPPSDSAPDETPAEAPK